jgi:multidrug resistance efflux pump
VYVVLTVVWPLIKSLQFLWKQRWDLVKRLSYMAGAAAAGLAVLAVVAALPVRNSIREPLVVLSESDEPVFVRTPGYVDEVLKDVGDEVKKGDVIVRLSDPALEQQLVKAQGLLQNEVLQAEEQSMKNQPTLLAISQRMIETYQKRIESLNQEIADLQLRAPVDGVIIRDTSLYRLRKNFVPASLKLCRVIRTDRLQARISLPQQKAAMVKAGMPVRMRLWADPDKELRSTVGRVSSMVSDDLPYLALGSQNKGEVDVKSDDKGQVRSTSRRSWVVIDHPAGEGFLADRMTGRGEIEFPRVTVAGRLWRLLLDSTTPDWHL